MNALETALREAMGELSYADTDHTGAFSWVAGYVNDWPIGEVSIARHQKKVIAEAVHTEFYNNDMDVRFVRNPFSPGEDEIPKLVFVGFQNSKYGNEYLRPAEFINRPQDVPGIFDWNQEGVFVKFDKLKEAADYFKNLLCVPVEPPRSEAV